MLAIAAAIAAVAILVGGRQVGLRTWWAPHGAYRAQTAAILAGHLALSDAPEAMQHDFAWTDDGAQQVWGLAPALWQAPFELAGRAVGVSPFPDRVALLAFLALLIYVLARAFVREGEPRWVGVGCVALVAGLPAFVTMLRGRFGVYEEAAAYAYGGAAILLAGCARHAADGTRSRVRYFILVAAAGCAGFLRPTTWCYGFATFVVASALQRRARDIAIGAALFVAGGAALYATNARRFGAGFEFGHHINLQAFPGNLYATRFSYPFERAPLGEASAELVGALFDHPDKHVHTTFYAKHLHVGQSALPRWREYYFTTFRWTDAAWILGGIVLGALAWRRRATPARGDPHARWLVAWAAIAGAPLVGFYLRAPFFSSRYAMDLAPAFAACEVIVWRWLQHHARKWPALALAAVWLATLVLARTAPREQPNGTPYNGAYAVGLDDARAARDEITHAVAHPHPLPALYDLDDPWLPTYTDVLEAFDRCTNATGTPIEPTALAVPGDTCLHGERPPDTDEWIVWQSVVPDGPDEPAPAPAASPLEEPVCRPLPTALDAGELVAATIPPPPLYLNAFRWNLQTGQVPPATYAWLEDPEFVELDIALLGGGEPDWSQVARVAIGRTHLRLVSLADAPDHATRLRFELPPGTPALRGLQVAFFAFGPDSELDHATTRFAVHKIRWRTR